MPTILGEKIKSLRKNRGFTLQELAEKTGSSKSYMWEIENKEVAKPSAVVLTRIAQALEVTTEYLVNDKQTEEPSTSKNEAFFRKYEGLDDATKKKLNQFLEMLEDNS